MISGINGSNLILESMAKTRVKNNMISKAKVTGSKGGYVVEFYGSCSEWKGSQMMLCSSRNPHEPRLFRSLDGAISQISRIGLKNISIEVE